MMNNKLVKIGLVALLSLSIVGCSNKASANNDVIATMAKQEANINEAFQQARINSKADGFFSIANSRLLEKDYSYKKNKKVKAAVDKQIKEIEKNNPDILTQYGVKNMMELMRKSGSLVTIQEEEYVKDTYKKEYVTKDSLRKLYDNREGELTSYYVIKISDSDFEGNTEKIAAAKKDISEQLKNATEKNVKEIFTSLAKKYPGTDNTNGHQDSVKRSEVQEKEVLTKIDKLKYLGFTKTPLIIGSDAYFILKTDNAERLSFEASKERLTTLQFDQAKEKNASLSDYILVKLREKNKISLVNKVDQDVYDQATKTIIDDYKENEKKKDGDQ